MKEYGCARVKHPKRLVRVVWNEFQRVFADGELIISFVFEGVNILLSS